MKIVLIMSILSSFLVSCSSVTHVADENKVDKKTTRKTYMQQLEERLVQKRANERKLAKKD